LPAGGHYDIAITYWPRKLTGYLAAAAVGLVGLLLLLWRTRP